MKTTLIPGEEYKVRVCSETKTGTTAVMFLKVVKRDQGLWARLRQPRLVIHVRDLPYLP